MSILVSIEGVLRTETGDPIHEGLKLYRTLAQSYRIVLATDGTKEEAEHWLRGNLLTGYADIYDNRMAYEGQDLRLRHLSLLKSYGPVEMFIDCDADRCAIAHSKMTPVILFAAPKFIRTKRSVKPWDDMKQELQRQKELTARIVLDDNFDKQWE
jgi:hypothetical protein